MGREVLLQCYKTDYTVRLQMHIKAVFWTFVTFVPVVLYMC